jgi:hypothetical protein
MTLATFFFMGPKEVLVIAIIVAVIVFVLARRTRKQ